MADGTIKKIQDVSLGDKLKSVDGYSINTVQKLIRPLLGNQNLYSINNEYTFFTANHPFLTPEGWKSLDPEITKLESPGLEVSTLHIGDVVLTEQGSILVMFFSHSSASASTPLYNFLLDGDHTYFANGFAVHNAKASFSNML
jgi:hypothetical protein